MPKLRARTRPWSDGKTIGITIAIVFVVVVTIMTLYKKRALAPTNTTDPSQITITTNDGIKLATTVKYPVRNSLSPAVILLHQYGADRHEWDPYLQKFLDAGVAVLSYDMRGFGDSRLPSIPADKTTHLNSLPLDLLAVLQYLKSQPSIDQTNISIIGASVGADVAYVASGSNLGLNHTVLLSPVIYAATLDGSAVSSFAPSGVYGLSSDTEQADLNSEMAKVADPKQTKIILNGGHGIELLASPGVLDSIIQWINQ